MRRLSPSSCLLSLLPALLALLSACSVTNTSHCGNLEGNATCSQRSAATPYCDICIADNDGCAAQAPAELSCLATTAPATTANATTSSTTEGPTTSSTTLEPTSTTGPTTSEPVTTTTGEPDTSTGPTTSEPDTSSTTTTTATSTGDTSTGDTSTGDTSTGDTSTGDTSDTGDTDSSGTTSGPFCGNNMIEGDEFCDGTDVDGVTCQALFPNKYSSGTLKCTKSCESFDDTACCAGVGMGCPLLGAKCCGGLVCVLGTCAVK